MPHDDGQFMQESREPIASREPCQHLTGYWINKAAGNFRCYQCQCQFHIGDNLPTNHPTGGIEVWAGEDRAEHLRGVGTSDALLGDGVQDEEAE